MDEGVGLLTSSCWRSPPDHCRMDICGSRCKGRLGRKGPPKGGPERKSHVAADWPPNVLKGGGMEVDRERHCIFGERIPQFVSRHVPFVMWPYRPFLHSG